MKVKEESEKATWKLNIQKMKVMASNPITSWQIYGETMEILTDFIFLGSKVTSDGDCSHEIKDTCSLEKGYEKPRQCIKKQRHYFANKGPSSQSYGFSSNHVWMWGLDHRESWALKNWCFWTVVLEKTLESPLDTRRSNQSILKEISPEYSLEGLMLKIKLQYFGHLMWTDLLEKTLMLGKIEGRKRRGRWMMNAWMALPPQRTWVWEAPGVGDGLGSLTCSSSWGRKWVTEIKIFQWWVHIKWPVSLFHMSANIFKIFQLRKNYLSS